MKLPNGHLTVVDIVKLTDYCLSAEHPRGKHKAQVFRSACGLTAENAEDMQRQLFNAAQNEEAVAVGSGVHGDRYVIEFELTGPTGVARVRSAWIVRPAEGFPRFVSAYVTK